ncbi:MAG: GTPase [Thalassobium sp.]|uniref:GTPase n=1 Tax=Thalassolituus pacificus TaxID=2975440 RepID=A0A9X3ASG4_9GAMM|nr:GTPase [Thalassolituus pacificus]MCT7360380.1 GTPase [Thalassolituus pacificus]PHS66287.1 MAG: GTPase [Thalassobium sp.]
MESPKTPIKLHIPTTPLAQPSFCAGNVEGVTQWAKELPMANTGEAARQLYQAIRELNQWNTDPLLRFKVLEVVRPYIYSICTLLNKHFLQSSISLNDKQLKIANLSQAMQGHLATGYKMVVAHSISRVAPADKPSKIVTLAIHRAISDTNQTILRAFQLYCQPPEHAWLEVNQLYLLAEMHKLLTFKVSDRQTRFLSTSTIQDVYIRAHLLGTAKPNNLRQQDLAQLYDASELWAEFASLSAADDESALFIINLHRDRPGQYRQHLRDAQKPLFRSLNTAKLVQALKHWAANPNGAHQITVPGKLSDNLLSHAIQSWGIHWQRSFRRAQTEGQLRICIGLSATHYYSGGQQDFEKTLASVKPKTLEGESSERSVDVGKASSEGDVWANAFDAGGARIAENAAMNIDAIEFINKHKAQDQDSEEETTKYPAHQVNLINTSPGGYCIHWSGDVPASIQAGELLGIQERGVKHWSIGVIRWIRHLRDQGTQLGVELLAPKAEVGAARLLQKTGSNGPFMRALLLPAIKAIAQPATLLLPRIPFRTGNKVELMYPEIQGRYQLTKRLTSTSSFSQFQFRGAGATSQPQSSGMQQTPGLGEDDFDSIWNKL